MADIDELRIKVNANAKNASAGLDKLCDSLNRIKKELNGGQIKGLQGMSNGIKELSKSLSGFNSISTDNITKFARSINSLTKGTSQANISSKANEIKKLADAMKGFNALGDFGSSFFRSLSRLDAAKLKEVSTVMPKASSAIKSMMNEMSKTKAVDKGITSLISAIGRLSGEKMKSARVELPQLTSALKRLFDTLKQMPKISDNTAKVVDAISRLSGRSGSVRSVASSFNALQSSGNRVSSMIHSLTSKLRSLTNGFRSVNVSAKSMVRGFLASYASLWGIKSAISGIKDAVTSATDYVEQFNYYDTAFDKVGADWKNQFKQYGYDSAQSYSDSFRTRMDDLMSKMTGFDIGKNGELFDNGKKSLGLDTTELMNYSAGVTQLANSLGMTGEATESVAQGMTMLSADWSSLTNQDQTQVMQNFQSALMGQSRAVYKYGLDITNASLQQTAFDNGIRKSVSDMTQGEKAQLRALYMIQHSRIAYGDLAKTNASAANQIRRLQNNFKQLSRTIGAIFLPVVQKVLPYVNGLVIAIRRLFEWTASMLGIKIGDATDGATGYSDALGDVADSADDAGTAIGGMADATNGAAEAQKKLNKQLQGFDKLNNLTTATTSGTDGSSGSDGSSSGSGGGEPIDLTSKLNKALSDYKDVWNKKYSEMTDDADKFADKLTEIFKKAWQSGDGKDIGSAIAGWLNKGIKYVNDHWDTIDKKAQKIADLLSTTINGFTYTFDWKGLGTALSNTLQTYLDGDTKFFDGTDWKAIGEGVATSLNSFIGDGEKGPIQSYLKNVASKLRAAIEFSFGLITTFDFKNLGKSIGNGINDFFDKMGKVNPDTKLNGWEELGKSISDGIIGITDSLNTALETVHWEDVGQAIADFIGQIKWGKIVWKLVKCAKSLARGIGKALKTETAQNPIATAITIGTLKLLYDFKKAKNVGTGTEKGLTLAQYLAQKLGKTRPVVKIKEALAKVKDWTLAKGGSAKERLSAKLAEKVANMAVKVKTAKATVKDWKVVKGSKNLIDAIKGSALVKDGIDIGEVIGKAKVIFGGFILGPSPAVDEIVRYIDEDVWTPFQKSLPGYDESAGILCLPKQLLFDCPAKIGEFLLINTQEDVVSKLQNSFDVLMTGGKGGTPSIKALVKYWTNTDKVDKTNKEIKRHSISKKVKYTVEDAQDFAKKEKDFINKYMQDKHAKWTITLDTKEKTKDWASKYQKFISARDKTTNWTIKMFYDNSALQQDTLYNPILTDNGKKNNTDQALTNSSDMLSNGNHTQQEVSEAIKKIVKYVPDTKDVKEADKKVTHGKKTKLTYTAKNGKSWYSHKKAFIDLAKGKTARLTYASKYGKGWAAHKRQYDSITDKTVTKTVKLLIDGKQSLTDWIKSNPYKKKAGGGVFAGGSWKPITAYAGGGLPNQGQMFVAREAGPELVGNLGGHTAVMNNNQIVASVSDGVFNALAPVLTSLCNSINAMNSNSGNGGDVVVQIDGNNVFNAVRKENTKYKNIHGKSALT